MWFTPGIALGGLIAVITYAVTGRCNQWWMWLVVLVVAGAVDSWMGFERHTRPKIPRESVYRQRKL